MKKSLRALGLGCALIASGCAISADPTQRQPIAAPPPIAAPAYDGALMKRTALVVSSIDRSLTIYRDILGFQLNAITQSSPTSYSYEVFKVPRDKPIRFATFNSGPDQSRSLAMIESAGVIHHNNDSVRPVALVINANGRLDEIMSKVKALGLTTVAPRPLKSDTQGDGIETAFVDYDGHLVVLYQFPNPDRPNKM
jgi:catechol 2,3-dioxygenase-like lactoylglutathione lyase family enzyme